MIVIHILKIFLVTSWETLQSDLKHKNMLKYDELTIHKFLFFYITLNL